jgi:putative transposase
MARLARWAVAGLAHALLLEGHNGAVVFNDDEDRRLLLDALKPACAAHHVTLHAVALPGGAVHLLARPDRAADLGAMVQTMGRRFVAAYNLRHGRRGTPWNGRYRSAPLQPGETTLMALLTIDGIARAAGGQASSRWSAAIRGWLVDPPELWALGNTPFEREQAYAQLLDAGVAAAERRRLDAAVHRGLPLGSPAFLAELSTQAGRAAAARPRGRPPKSG